jgi:hypothetical protein
MSIATVTQVRETLERGGYKLIGRTRNNNAIIVKDEDGDYHRFIRSDGHAPYLIMYNGAAYEYYRALTTSDVLRLLG